MQDNNNNSDNNQEELFESKLLQILCNKLAELGEISSHDEFLESYPKENLADIHNNETGAYYLMNREKPVKLVEYNLVTFEVFEV